MLPFPVLASLIEQAAHWWRGAQMWSLMYRGSLILGTLAAAAFVAWQVIAAKRERARLERLVESRTRQLRQSEELFRSIFEHASEGVFQSSLDGRNLRANPAMAALCGYAGPEEMGRLLTDVGTQFYARPERRAEVAALVARHGMAANLESEIRHRDGGTLWVSENVRIVTDPASGARVYQGSIVDVTARRALEAAQEQARAAAEAASRAKSTFLAQITHELRTPLTGILGSARVALRDPAMDAKNGMRFSLIAESGEHLLGLIDEVLDLSRIEAGRMELRTAAFDLPGLLQTAAGEFQLRAAEARLEFRQEADPSLARTVWGDARRLRQVLLNLLGNAFKFTERGMVTLRAARAEAGGEAVRFEVEDTGIGIPPDQTGAIFEAFHQVPGPGCHGAGGAGLGLNISARLVELLGGRLQVASEPGRGSRFWFAVPLPEAAGGEVPVDATSEEAPAAVLPTAQPRDFTLPPPAEIEGLLTLTQAGDILRVRARLAALGTAYPAFTAELARLAAGFQMDAIGAFLQSALAEEPADPAPSIHPHE